jgi:2-oxo-4-hydroxy-4-carboxy-5-ureidoimidazoline decarboxylase
MPPDPRLSLAQLNAVDGATFAELLAGIVEHAPEIAAEAARHRPFPSVAALHEAFFGGIAALPEAEQIALIARHPELAGREADAGMMTAESVSEQGGLGLDRLSAADAARLRNLNAAYRARFGFPFMICVRRHTLASIFREGEKRLANGRNAEREEALRQIFFVTRLRIVDRVQGPGAPRTGGELVVTVTDGRRPLPKADVELHDERSRVLAREAGEDGRAVLLTGQPLRIGQYRLVGRSPGSGATGSADLAITQAEADYHVSLSIDPTA